MEAAEEEHVLPAAETEDHARLRALPQQPLGEAVERGEPAAPADEQRGLPGGAQIKAVAEAREQIELRAEGEGA